jgi:hypothetical protein
VQSQTGNAYCEPGVLSALASLEADLAGIVAEHGTPAVFWRVFCERAIEIEALSGPDGWMYVNGRLDAMLGNAGIDPGGWSDVFDA